MRKYQQQKRQCLVEAFSLRENVVVLTLVLGLTCSMVVLVVQSFSKAFSMEFASNHNNIIDTTTTMFVEESMVSMALEAQMNIWPPMSACVDVTNLVISKNNHNTNDNVVAIQQWQQQQHPFVSPHNIRKEILQLYQEGKGTMNKTPGFVTVGRRLLNYSMIHNQTLLTLQIGGMDGYSNDPMYRMFVKKGQEEEEGIYNNNNQQRSLQHWMPIVVEGGMINFQKLYHNYKSYGALSLMEPNELQQYVQQQQQQKARKNHNDRGIIPCSLIEHWAISYHGEPSKKDGSNNHTYCEFCRFNNDLLSQSNPPPLCKQQPYVSPPNKQSNDTKGFLSVCVLYFLERATCVCLLPLETHTLISVFLLYRLLYIPKK